MTDATYISGTSAPRPRSDPAETVQLPAPVPYSAPVFIHDAVTPLAGETVLSLLMKRLARDDQR